MPKRSSSKRWLKEHFKDPNLGALSGPVAYFNSPILTQISKFAIFATFETIGLFFGHQMLAGPNMVLRKSLWEKVKNDVCMFEKDVHEDFDLSTHLAKIAKIKYDWYFGIRTTRGRWLKIFTEYIARFIKMLISHKLKPASFSNKHQFK